MSNFLTETAKELDSYLRPKLNFYFTVGWVKEQHLNALVVYYDSKKTLPKGVVPSTWKGCRVRTQETIPLGERAPEEDEEIFTWYFQ